MIVICESVFQAQQWSMNKMLIPLYKNTSDIYHLNILIIIAIICHIYIESELYNLVLG